MIKRVFWSGVLLCLMGIMGSCSYMLPGLKSDFSSIEPYSLKGQPLMLIYLKKEMDIGPWHIHQLAFDSVINSEDGFMRTAVQKVTYQMDINERSWQVITYQGIAERTLPPTLSKESIKRLKLKTFYPGLLVGKLKKDTMTIAGWQVEHLEKYSDMPPMITGIMDLFGEEKKWKIKLLTSLPKVERNELGLSDMGYWVESSDSVNVCVAELSNEGRLWIKPDVPERWKTLLVAVYSSLMLRSDLQPTF